MTRNIHKVMNGLPLETGIKAKPTHVNVANRNIIESCKGSVPSTCHKSKSKARYLIT